MPDILELLHTAPEPAMDVPTDTLLTAARARARRQRFRRYAVGGGLLAAAAAAVVVVASGGLPKAAPWVPATRTPSQVVTGPTSPSQSVTGTRAPTPSPSPPRTVIPGGTPTVLPLTLLFCEQNTPYEISPTEAGYVVSRIERGTTGVVGTVPLPRPDSPISWVSDSLHPFNQIIVTLADAEVAVVSQGEYRWQLPYLSIDDIGLTAAADGRAKVALFEGVTSEVAPITAGVVVRGSGEVLSTESEVVSRGERTVEGFDVRMAYLGASDVWLCWIDDIPCVSFNLSDRQDDIRTMLAVADTTPRLEAFLPPLGVTGVKVRTTSREAAPLSPIRLGARTAYVLALQPDELFRDITWTTPDGNQVTVQPKRG